jgi:hypothetical protein
LLDGKVNQNTKNSIVAATNPNPKIKYHAVLLYLGALDKTISMEITRLGINDVIIFRRLLISYSPYPLIYKSNNVVI